MSTFRLCDRVRVIRHERINEVVGAIGTIVEVLDKPSRRGNLMYTVKLDDSYEALGFGSLLVVDENEIEAADRT